MPQPLPHLVGLYLNQSQRAGSVFGLCWGMQGPGGFFHVASHFWDNFLIFNSCSWLVKSCYSSSNYICCFRAEILSCNSYLGSNTAIPRTPSGGPEAQMEEVSERGAIHNGNIWLPLPPGHPCLTQRTYSDGQLPQRTFQCRLWNPADLWPQLLHFEAYKKKLYRFLFFFSLSAVGSEYLGHSWEQNWINDQLKHTLNERLCCKGLRLL